MKPEMKNQNKMNKKQIALLARVSVSNALYAAEQMDCGNGCNTVGFCLGLHWKTASAAMNLGQMLPRVIA